MPGLCNPSKYYHNKWFYYFEVFKKNVFRFDFNLIYFSIFNACLLHPYGNYDLLILTKEWGDVLP